VIAGGVSIVVVDALQPVDIEKGNDETTVAPTCAIDLMAECEPASLAAEDSGEGVQMGTVQLGLQAGALARGLGSILRSAGAIGCGTSADLRELLRQWRIRRVNGAVDRLSANVPASRRLVARGRGGVAPGGGLDPQTTGPRSGGMGGLATDRACLACHARGFVGFKRRSIGSDGQLLVGARLVLFRGTLITRRVGLVSLCRGLVGV
jgi:hypothetical protein